MERNIHQSHQQMFHEEQIRVDLTALPQYVDAAVLETFRTRLDGLEGDVLEHPRFDHAKDLGEDAQDATHWWEPCFVGAQLGRDGVVRWRRASLGLVGLTLLILLGVRRRSRRRVVVNYDCDLGLLAEQLTWIIQVGRQGLEPRHLLVKRVVCAKDKSLLCVLDDPRNRPGRGEGGG